MDTCIVVFMYCNFESFGRLAIYHFWVNYS